MDIGKKRDVPLKRGGPASDARAAPHAFCHTPAPATPHKIKKRVYKSSPSLLHTVRANSVVGYVMMAINILLNLEILSIT